MKAKWAVICFGSRLELAILEAIKYFFWRPNSYVILCCFVFISFVRQTCFLQKLFITFSRPWKDEYFSCTTAIWNFCFQWKELKISFYAVVVSLVPWCIELHYILALGSLWLNWIHLQMLGTFTRTSNFVLRRCNGRVLRQWLIYNECFMQ